MSKIRVQETEATVISFNDKDYISLTDIAKYKSNDPFIVVCNWMRSRMTIEYLGLWETLYNPGFKGVSEKSKHLLGNRIFDFSIQ